jgi:hypothetical protein
MIEEIRQAQSQLYGTSYFFVRKTLIGLYCTIFGISEPAEESTPLKLGGGQKQFHARWCA